MTEHVIRSGCVGATPLTARLEPWQVELCRDPSRLEALLETHGSPINVLDVGPLARNADELLDVARRHGIDLRIFLARKANKALGVVDEAARLGHGIDVASEQELRQVLERGVGADDVVLTAAVKPRALLQLAITNDVVIVIDNRDELELLRDVATRAGARARIAVRIAARVTGARAPTRFGMDPSSIGDLFDDDARIELVGIHFHLDGYSAPARVQAIDQALLLADDLRERGHPIAFVDMGGGIPMSYLDSAQEWHAFWRQHRAGLLDPSVALTLDGHGLGLLVHDEQVLGDPNVYPYHQLLVRGAWLEQVLVAELPTLGETVADAIRSRALELRCEPGRSMLDGCGMTLARVAFRKQRADGVWLVGLDMNRTQCRSTSDDFLVDPLLLRPGSNEHDEGDEAIDAYLVGAYCIERELLTWRRLRFPRGVRVGDLVAFPNTAGYLMHILESASHQIPLACNLLHVQGEIRVDPIDSGCDVTAESR